MMENRKCSGRDYLIVLYYSALIALTIALLLSVSCVQANLDQPNDSASNVKGTVIGIILIETLSSDSFLIVELDDERKYRLKPEHGLSFIPGSDVELKAVVCSEDSSIDEASQLYEDLVCVDWIVVTTMAIPGTKRKIKYPPSDPPEILYQSEEILKRIEKFKERETGRKGGVREERGTNK